MCGDIISTLVENPLKENVEGMTIEAFFSHSIQYLYCAFFEIGEQY